MAPDADRLLEIAREAAVAAGALLVEHAARPPRDVRTKSTPTDPVSAADLAAEALIRARIARARPGDAILGEEGGQVRGGAAGSDAGSTGDAAQASDPMPASDPARASDATPAGNHAQASDAARTSDAGAGHVRWIVDPLDGTVNFLYRIPQWSVSIACEDADGPIAGVVHDPLRGETFAATRDGAATCNGERLVPSTRTELATALVATGFGYDAERRARQAAVAARVVPHVRDVRRLGSAALDLVWTAAGRYDAYYEHELQPWDRAAGALICARAGLDVMELGDGDLGSGGVVVAPPALSGPLLELVRGRA